MEQSRRDCLNTIRWDAARHAGLWLDKYLSRQLRAGEQVPTGEQTPQAQLVEEVARFRPPEAYDRFYARWQAALTAAGATTQLATVQGRLSVGLGAESVLETSICLHRTYSVPYIPGSALKGLAASYAHRQLQDKSWQQGGQAHRILFGDTKAAGYVTFFDALYVPGTAHQGKPLWPDVITVHHPDYYQGDEPPADWDSPNPISFLAATGTYLLALAGPSEWVQAAFAILGMSLGEEGVGAKTNSSYGRLVLGQPSQAVTPQPPEKTHELARIRLLREETPREGRFRGTVVKVQATYAFINPALGGAQMFVHQSQLQPPASRLVEGQVVEYSEGTYKGRIQAQQVVVLLEPDR